MSCRSAHVAVVRVHPDREPDLLLNLRRNPIYWELPGGMPELQDGYNPHAAAIRETDEEVGLSIAVLRSLIPIEIMIPSEKFPDQYYLILLFFVPSDFTLDHDFTNDESRGNWFFPLSTLTKNSPPDGGYEFVKFQREYFLPHILDYLKHTLRT